jgi:hypothetical protein
MAETCKDKGGNEYAFSKHIMSLDLHRTATWVNHDRRRLSQPANPHLGNRMQSFNFVMPYTLQGT